MPSPVLDITNLKPAVLKVEVQTSGEGHPPSNSLVGTGIVGTAVVSAGTEKMNQAGKERKIEWLIHQQHGIQGT